VRRLGRGRRGPGLLGTMARTAVVAGTATAVSGKVAASQEAAARDRAELEARRRAELTPPTQPTPQAVDELLDRLTRLGELRAAGVLSEEEFAAAKARIVGG
jgi:hypothetical protein